MLARAQLTAVENNRCSTKGSCLGPVGSEGTFKNFFYDERLTLVLECCQEAFSPNTD